MVCPFVAYKQKEKKKKERNTNANQSKSKSKSKRKARQKQNKPWTQEAHQLPCMRVSECVQEEGGGEYVNVCMWLSLISKVYSHSVVPGGLAVRSYMTRATWSSAEISATIVSSSCSGS